MRRLVLSAATSSLLALGLLTAMPAPAHAADTDVKINEVESQDGIPGDWVELVNVGMGTVAIGGWTVKDNGEGNNVILPMSATIAAGARYTVDMSGLGDNDEARLFNGGTLIDSLTWVTPANGTWSRCPEGTGANLDTIGTKNLPNACSNEDPWPGGGTYTTADAANAFGGGNMSGLAYEGSGSATPGTIWAVKNSPGTLYKVAKSGGTWAPTLSWDLNYPTGLGDPDAEGVTITDAGAAGGVYVATERDGGGSSLPAILRFAPTGASGSLTATNEWDLSADLPGLGANLGPEAVAWVPDTYLTANGFKVGVSAYNPANYANHGTGLFFVGIEQTGQVIGYALNHVTNTFTRLATITNSLSSVMDLVYDPELQKLWVACDDTCGGRTALFGVDTAAGPTQGSFVSTIIYERPFFSPNLNNEGFTIASRTECVGNVKLVFFADDSNTGGNSLRTLTLNCTPGAGPTITGGASSAKAKTADGWYGAAVTVTFACTPGSSPISGGCPAPVILATSGADQSVTRTVHNGDFVTATATVNDLDIDVVAPTVKIKGVKKGKTYGKKKKPKCVGTDALSGIASCTIAQKKKGSKYKVTATATDKAGNVTVVKLTYKVKKG
jgi:Lamin Tail Domain